MENTGIAGIYGIVGFVGASGVVGSAAYYPDNGVATGYHDRLFYN